MPSEELKGIVVFASVADDASGIHLRVQVDKDLKLCFVPKEAWGKISEGKNPQKELQIIADLFNGIERDSLGDIRPIDNFTPKTVNILIQDN